MKLKLIKGYGPLEYGQAERLARNLRQDHPHPAYLVRRTYRRKRGPEAYATAYKLDHGGHFVSVYKREQA